jgi:hypothetical protein
LLFVIDNEVLRSNFAGARLKTKQYAAFSFALAYKQGRDTPPTSFAIIKYVGSNFSAFKACQKYSSVDKLKSVFSIGKGRESGEPIITYRRRASGRVPV